MTDTDRSPRQALVSRAAPGPREGWCVVGGGGHARSVVDLLTSLDERVAYLVTSDGQRPAWYDPTAPVLGDEDVPGSTRTAGAAWAVAVGDNALRRRLHAWLESLGCWLPALMAGTSTVSSTAHVGQASIAFEHSHVGPGADLGTGAIVNTGAIVEHDALVGAFSHVAPGSVLLGGCRLGADSVLGARASVLPGISVGDRSVVGAGAVVVRDLAEDARVTGIPARTQRGTP